MDVKPPMIEKGGGKGAKSKEKRCVKCGACAALEAIREMKTDYLMNSYKTRNSAAEKSKAFPAFLEEMERLKKKMETQRSWDHTSEQWREHVLQVAKKNFGGTPEQWEILKDRMLLPYADCFWDVGCPAPEIKNVVADVRLKPDACYSVRRPFPLSQFDEACLCFRICEFEGTGQLYSVPAFDTSPWASPVFIVDKVGDPLGRIVCDYDGLNKATEEHPGIPADVESMLYQACGKELHSVCDMAWGFSQISWTHAAQVIFTIATKWGLKWWSKVTFGLKQGPGICQSSNDSVFGNLENTNVYVDDFHTGTMTCEEHIETLIEMFERGREHGVQWKITKCKWVHKKVILVGFECSKAGRKPDPEKVAQLEKWPLQDGLGDLRSLYHFANYLRSFIPCFCRVVQPIKPYLKKNAKWILYIIDTPAQDTVKALRDAVAIDVPLVNPSYEVAVNYVSSG